ncbi:MAG: DUF4381 family protein [Polyangiaceae bacterium]
MTPDDIRDIRGPIAIPYWWMPYAIGAGVLLALLLVFFAYRALRRYRLERAKSAAELALQRIERARAALQTLTSAEFSAEVSNAVRVYIEARFGLLAAHRTTEEFLHDLLGAVASPVATHREALEDFLSWCDLAKFARLALTPSHADAMVAAARHFVESTAAPLEKKRRSRHGNLPDVPREAEPPAISEVGT